MTWVGLHEIIAESTLSSFRFSCDCLGADKIEFVDSRFLTIKILYTAIEARGATINHALLYMLAASLALIVVGMID
jgi:hypothetical protein